MLSQDKKAGKAVLPVEGEVVIAERSVAIEPGTTIGATARFTAGRRRTANGACAADVWLRVIASERFGQIYVQIPEFGLYQIRIIERRSDADHGIARRSNLARMDDHRSAPHDRRWIATAMQFAAVALATRDQLWAPGLHGGILVGWCGGERPGATHKTAGRGPTAKFQIGQRL